MNTVISTSSSRKTVIFVGGTSFSGSTLIDMILANDPTGISCGEVYAVYYPFRSHHLRLDELGNVIDWRAMKKSGPKNLYTNLFKQFPSCQFIVDSSKSPLWISERSQELQAAGIRTMNILIWKTPDEFLASRRKRGTESGWQREWINYHRYYFTLLKDWRSVKYRDLVTNKDSLTHLCSFLGIPHFPGKERYWEAQQHSVFGNDTAKIHLFDPTTTEFAKAKSAIATDLDHAQISEHRTISYGSTDRTQRVVKEGLLQTVTAILESFDVANTSNAGDEIRSQIDAIRMNLLYQSYQVARLKLGLGWIIEALRR